MPRPTHARNSAPLRQPTVVAGALAIAAVLAVLAVTDAPSAAGVAPASTRFAPGPVTTKTCHNGGGHVLTEPKNLSHRVCHRGRWAGRDIQL